MNEEFYFILHTNHNVLSNIYFPEDRTDKEYIWKIM